MGSKWNEPLVCLPSGICTPIKRVCRGWPSTIGRWDQCGKRQNVGSPNRQALAKRQHLRASGGPRAARPREAASGLKEGVGGGGREAGWSSRQEGKQRPDLQAHERSAAYSELFPGGSGKTLGGRRQGKDPGVTFCLPS